MIPRNNNCVYGPVVSWRFGRSLGIDLLAVDSICSFECVYCQLGKINRVVATRELYVPTETVIRDLLNSPWEDAEVITLSGSGEPTLAKNLGEIIDRIREVTGKTINVLTNSTMLFLPEVRDELTKADRVFCKLDAWDDDVFRRFNKPHDAISLKETISGIRAFRDNFKGFMGIQSMMLRPPDHDELKKFGEILRCLDPDEIQLNIPSRPIPKEYSSETRGNITEISPGSTILKTISIDELKGIRKHLAHQTGIPVIIHT